MKKELLEQYAKLLANVGINVEKGDEVWISAGLDQPEFVEMVVEECYKAGAKRVQVEWYYDPLSKLNYKYMTLGELGKVPPYRLARLKYSAKKLPSTLYIVSDDPDALKGVNVNKMAKARMKQYPKIKPYRDAMDGKYKWCIAGVPGLKWAKKIFPKLSDEEAIEALWEKILLTSRVDETNTVQNWKEHNDFLVKQSKKLHDLNLKYLYYKSSTGTDFKVELIPGINWGAGIEHTDKGKVFNPNIPTEEVFTSPLAGSCEGKLVATKPLSYQGQLIEDFYFVFKDGKVSEVHAKKNQEALEKMVKMDECASMLGEVALVHILLRSTKAVFSSTRPSMMKMRFAMSL